MTTEFDENDQPIGQTGSQILNIEQTESVRLIKNAKGNYQWEIKLIGIDLKRLDEINNTMKKRYGDDRDD